MMRSTLALAALVLTFVASAGCGRSTLREENPTMTTMDAGLPDLGMRPDARGDVGRDVGRDSPAAVCGDRGLVTFR